MRAINSQPIMILADNIIIDTLFYENELEKKLIQAYIGNVGKEVKVVRGWKNYGYSDEAKERWRR